MTSIEELLYRQIPFSIKAFGEGERLEGILNHIREELNEIAVDPSLDEWADVILLALDGAWRQGYTPQAIAIAIETKQRENINRNWDEIGPPNQPIHHQDA